MVENSSGIIVTDEGLYCPAGDFFIDPWKPVKKAVVTHAHADHLRPGSREYVVTTKSKELTRIRATGMRDKFSSEITTYDFDETFSINGVILSFHPAGHILGSAQVRIEIGSEVWVVSGDYKRAHDPSCTPFDVQQCDTFITEGTFGLPIYRWEPATEVVSQMYDWWIQNAADNKPSVLFTYSLGKTQRILAELNQFTNETIYLHGALEKMTQCYRNQDIDMLETELVSEQPKSKKYRSDLIAAPPSALRSKWMNRFKGCETAFASGWMRIRGKRRMGGYDKGFVISDHADWPNLVKTIKETKASNIQIAYTQSPIFQQYLSEEMGLNAIQLSTQYSGEDD